MFRNGCFLFWESEGREIDLGQSDIELLLLLFLRLLPAAAADSLRGKQEKVTAAAGARRVGTNWLRKRENWKGHETKRGKKNYVGLLLTPTS